MNTFRELVIKSAYKAGEEILKVYNSDDFDIELKGDKSPLTLADKKSHNTIVSYLNETPYPILSEEGKEIPYSDRKYWETFWMIDPLDGTKEFIKRNGEFTVNIALIHKQCPVFGVVYAPTLDKLYFGGENYGAYLLHNNIKTQFNCNRSKSKVVRVVASRSHLNKETQDFINKFENIELISMGSSLKFMLILEDKADIYPRFAPTMEWDSAAAHAILKAVNIEIKNIDSNTSLFYNKENLLNPFFLVS